MNKVNKELFKRNLLELLNEDDPEVRLLLRDYLLRELDYTSDWSVRDSVLRLIRTELDTYEFKKRC